MSTRTRVTSVAGVVSFALLTSMAFVAPAFADDGVPDPATTDSSVVTEQTLQEPAADPPPAPPITEEEVIETDSTDTSPPPAEEDTTQEGSSATTRTFQAQARTLTTATTEGVTGTLVPWTSATNHASYWEDYTDHIVACYKYDANGQGNSSNEHGSSNGKTVTLNPYGSTWPGDHWELLVVKGGSEYNNVIVHPTAGTAYASPPNSGGQQSKVSHWIACKGETPFDWNWEYATPTCTALTVVYPENIPNGQANDVNVRFENLLTNQEITLNFHKDSGTWSGTKVFEFTSHPNWPGWTYYKVEWVQVAGTNYHWEGTVTCGTPPPVVFTCPAVTDGPIATNLDEAGWFHTDTRATGEWEYVDGAVVLRTTDTANPGSSQNKATMYRTVSGAMATFGEPSVTFGNGSGGKPGLQAQVDLDNNGVADAMLVSEPWVNGYGDSWSLFNPIGGTAPQSIKDNAPHTGGGKASTWWGSWHEWIVAFPNAQMKLVGLSLGSGVLGDWEVLSYQGGCVRFGFDYVAPEASFTSPTILDRCGTANDGTPVYGSSEHGTWKTSSVTKMDDGSTRYRVVFTPDTDYVVPPPGEGDTYKIVDGKAVWLLYTTDEPCPDAVSTPPVLIDECGVENDGVQYGESENGTWKTGSVTEMPDGTTRYRVVFTPNEDFVVPTPGEGDAYIIVDGKAVWKLYATDESCDEPTTPPQEPEPEKPTKPTQSLASTGADVGGYIGGGLLLLLVGGVLFALRRRRAA